MNTCAYLFAHTISSILRPRSRVDRALGQSHFPFSFHDRSARPTYRLLSIHLAAAHIWRFTYATVAFKIAPLVRKAYVFSRNSTAGLYLFKPVVTMQSHASVSLHRSRTEQEEKIRNIHIISEPDPC